MPIQLTTSLFVDFDYRFTGIDACQFYDSTRAMLSDRCSHSPASPIGHCMQLDGVICLCLIRLSLAETAEVIIGKRCSPLLAVSRPLQVSHEATRLNKLERIPKLLGTFWPVLGFLYLYQIVFPQQRFCVRVSGTGTRSGYSPDYHGILHELVYAGIAIVPLQPFGGSLMPITESLSRDAV